MITTLHAFKRSLKKLYDQGDIYKSSYKGHVLHALRGVLDGDAAQGAAECAPIAAARLKRLRKKSYFLNVSKYAPCLIEYIETHP